MGKSDQLELGKDILSYCGKCKMAIGHIIMSMHESGAPGRCECQTCGAVHHYRDPEGLKKKAGASSKSPKKPSTRKPVVSGEKRWRDALLKAGCHPKPYKMSEAYEAGDLIEHPTFGRGVALELIGDKKMKVIFEDSEKVLIFGRQD